MSRLAVLLASSATLVFGAIFLLLDHRAQHDTASPRIDFNRDIRPILNQSCTSCHGGVKQAGDVSFIYREQALGKGKSGRPIIVPGNPEASEFIARLITKDAESRMPYRAPPLKPQQIALLKQWIKEGAQWQDHWAFVPPRPQKLPAVKDSQWPRQPLDRFILARLEQEGLTPSPETDKETLLRRLSFDLTGLPPTPQELSAFLADTSPDAYEKQVNRLLSSPHYGERWAAVWLDLARYADSRGYQRDPVRATWPYRDWVIEAFNRNLPYDDFVVRQLAGDLLPNASFADLIATSFQRQTPVGDDGNYEEYRNIAVMDRVATTWSVLNGLTVNCVQCHSHPYDPIRHEEYYKFLAFYNSSRDADLPSDAPFLRVPKDTAKRDEVAKLQAREAELLRSIVSEGRAMAERAQWMTLPVGSAQLDELSRLKRQVSQLRMEESSLHNTKGLSAAQRSEKLEFLRRQLSTATAELRRAQTEPMRPLKVNRGEVEADGTIASYSVYELRTVGAPERVTALRIEVPPSNPESALHTPEEGFIVERLESWVVSAAGQESKIDFRYFVPDSEENLSGVSSVVPGILTLGASSLPSDLSSTKTGAFAAETGLFRTRWVIGVPETPLQLVPGSNLKVRLVHGQDIALRPAPVRKVRLSTSSEGHWTAWAASAELSQPLAELTAVRRQLAQIPAVPLPIMAEIPAYQARQTLLFDRGNQLQKTGTPLSADVPRVFAGLPANARRDRLTLAQWFFQPDQPLTARVAVNRYWEQLFGTGIVETLEDFGSSGTPPSHPELLDWLALRFQKDLRWDMKALLRELVTSATYRQDAKATPDLLSKDPRNYLLARGPQQRLTAEMVRDQALIASGLFNPAMGGPPVMPPQPAAVRDAGIEGGGSWEDATGPDRYRRAIYTLLKRGSLYPSFVAFDIANHVTSSARRVNTNTPLQALVTLNDPVYQEAAQALARQMLKVEGKEARLKEGAKRVLSRSLRPDEMVTLVAFYDDARKLSAASRGSDITALTAVASALLNLDAALTR